MSWTDDRVATLTKLWADGLSASQIAAELGGVTRNAVIGKVHRLGLSGRAKPTSSGSKHVSRKPRNGGHNSRPRSAPRSNPANSYSGERRIQIEDMVAPECKKLQLVDLTEKTCKCRTVTRQPMTFIFAETTPKLITHIANITAKWPINRISIAAATVSVLQTASGLIQTFGTRFPRPLIQIFES